MAQEKVFSFDYRVKEKDAEGNEQSVKKDAEATALQFVDTADIIAYYEAEEAGQGEALLVAAINKMFKDTAIANERAKLTRVPKVPKAMAERAKGLSDEEQAEFAALMEKMGLKTD